MAAHVFIVSRALGYAEGERWQVGHAVRHFSRPHYENDGWTEKTRRSNHEAKAKKL